MEETQGTPETPEKRKEPTAIVVRNGSTFTTRLKDEHGRFISRKKNKFTDAKELKKAMHKVFTSAEADVHGNLIKGGKAKWQKVLEALIDTASYVGDEVALEDGTTKVVKDPKLAMAQVQAAKLLIQQFIGKEPVAPEEIDAMKTAGIKVVVVQAPELMNKESQPERKEHPTVPSFLEAEVIQQN